MLKSHSETCFLTSKLFGRNFWILNVLPFEATVGVEIAQCFLPKYNWCVRMWPIQRTPYRNNNRADFNGCWSSREQDTSGSEYSGKRKRASDKHLRMKTGCKSRQTAVETSSTLSIFLCLVLSCRSVTNREQWGDGPREVWVCGHQLTRRALLFPRKPICAR